MKTAFPFLLVAAAVFAVVAWFLLEKAPDDGEAIVLEDGVETALRGYDPRGGSSGGAARRDQAVPDLVEPLDAAEPAGAAAGARGELVLRATIDGRLPDELQVELIPPAAAPRRENDAIVFADLPPGAYGVSVHGEDIVPEARRGLLVEAGRRRIVTIDLERGLRFRGQVLHADRRRPIPFAEIDFGGRARVAADAEGWFDVGRLLPREALRLITVRSEDWDTLVYRDLRIEDPDDMRLYVGGGQGEVTLRIVNETEDPFPPAFVARVRIPHLGETRRERRVEGEDRVTFGNLYDGVFRFEVAFPDGSHPTVFQDFEVGSEASRTTLLFELRPGATLAGEAIGPELLLGGAAVELRAGMNEVRARAEVGEDRRWELRHVPPGTYELYVVVGGNARAARTLEIVGGERLDLDLDLLRMNVVER